MPDKGRSRTKGGAGQREILGPAGCGLSDGLKYSPRKNSIVLEPRQRGGHNPKTDRTVIKAKQRKRKKENINL
jgi:hypothetical protein